MVNLVSVPITLLPFIIHFKFGLLSEVRQKRVLYGRISVRSDRDYTPSFRYYVFFSVTRPARFWEFFGLFLSPDPEDLACGGSLITPYIIQTAAHCIATVVNKGKFFSDVLPRHIDENPLYAYIGHNIATEMKYWLHPQVYIPHEKTKFINAGNRFLSGWLYDFGLVVTKTNVIERTPKAKINYVPAYPENDIENFYDFEAFENEYMCLHVGHGYWRVTFDPSADAEISSASSDPIRWGWRTLMRERDCEIITYSHATRAVHPFNYTQEHSWVCSQTWKHVPKEKDLLYHVGKGDSGGPVTCNNVYFAVVSRGSRPRAHAIISWDSAIVHTLFENAAENRAQFIEYYTRYAFDNDNRRIATTSATTATLIGHFLLLLAIFTSSLSFWSCLWK